MGQGVPHRIGRHTHPMARPEPASAPAATGIDYLALLADRHSIELDRLTPRIDYTTLVESTDPAQCPGQLHNPTTTESDHQ